MKADFVTSRSIYYLASSIRRYLFKKQVQLMEPLYRGTLAPGGTKELARAMTRWWQACQWVERENHRQTPESLNEICRIVDWWNLLIYATGPAEERKQLSSTTHCCACSRNMSRSFRSAVHCLIISSKKLTIQTFCMLIPQKPDRNPRPTLLLQHVFLLDVYFRISLKSKGKVF